MPTQLSKTDYAANGGSVLFLGSGPPYPNTNCYPNCTGPIRTNRHSTGPWASEVKPGQNHRWPEQRVLCGKKYLNPSTTTPERTGPTPAGPCRAMASPSIAGSSTGFPPMHDTRGVNSGSYGFGSTHNQGLHFVFCDGSTRLINYSISFTVFQSLAVRNDGTVSEIF